METLKLYRLSESQAEAAALVGVDDIERYGCDSTPWADAGEGRDPLQIPGTAAGASMCSSLHTGSWRAVQEVCACVFSLLAMKFLPG
jgi:hypothetical protein